MTASQIFLSYASADRDRATRVAQALAERGWSVFWDREIPPGRTWHEVLDEQLSAARCIVVLWSTTSVASQWVREEAEEGTSRHILVPAFIDAVEPPRGFRGIQGASLVAWDGGADDREFAKLCESVGSLLAEDGEAKLPERGRSSPAPDAAGSSQGASKWKGRRIAILCGVVALLLAAGYAAMQSFESARAPTKTDAATTPRDTRLEVPHAPPIEYDGTGQIYEENIMQFSLEPGASRTVKAMEIWKGLVGSQPSCATAWLLFTWQVRDPYPGGGSDLEFRQPIKMGGGVTEVIAEGSSGSSSMGWCSTVDVTNRSLVPVLVELRYASGEN